MLTNILSELHLNPLNNMAGFSLPIPASSRTSAVSRRSRRPYVFAMGALLCLAAVGTVTVTDTGAGILSAAMGNGANAAEHAAHVQRREDLVAQMLDKLNGLSIPTTAAATGGIWASTATPTPSEAEPDVPGPTDAAGNEIEVVLTREQAMLDNDWTEAELDAHLDPNNPLYDPILDSQIRAPPPVNAATNTTSTATETSTSATANGKSTSTTKTAAKTTTTSKPTTTAKPKPSGDNGDD